MRHLLRILGAGYGVAVAVGATIGVGILRTPGEVAGHLPGVAPIVLAWVAGGLFALLAACPMAELAAAVPNAGGHYGFARRALGGYPSFVVGWFDFVTGSGSVALLALAAAEQLGRLWPQLGATRAVAWALLGAMVALQFSGIRASARTQGVMSALKALGLLAFVFACFAAPGGTMAAPPGHAPGGAVTLGAFALALQSVVWTYDGWHGAVYLGEEMRDPGRQMPRAIFGTVLLVLALYVLVNVAMLHVAAPAALAHEEVALGAVAAHLAGDGVDRVISAFLVISALGTIGALQIGTPRVLFALARDGLAPRRAVWVTARGTPGAGVLVSATISALFIATGHFEDVLAAVTPILVSVLVLDVASVLVLRRREPGLPRPFRAPGHPVTTLLALACAFAFLLGVAWGDPEHTAVAAGLLLASYPAYHLLFAATSRPDRAS